MHSLPADPASSQTARPSRASESRRRRRPPLSRRRVRALVATGQTWRELDSGLEWQVAWSPRWKDEIVRLERAGNAVWYRTFRQLGADFELVGLDGVER